MFSIKTMNYSSILSNYFSFFSAISACSVVILFSALSALSAVILFSALSALSAVKIPAVRPRHED